MNNNYRAIRLACVPSGRVAILLVLAGCAIGTSQTEGKHPAITSDQYKQAKAIFAERCKTAGAVIRRTVRDVDGVELVKIRPKLDWADPRYSDPMFDGAAMASEAQGDSYIASFLYSEIRNPNTPEQRGLIQPPSVKPGLNQSNPIRGYAYVDIQDASAGRALRYRVAPNLGFEDFRKRGGWAKDIEREYRAEIGARYAIDYTDIVNPADRMYWIAGTRIKVLDRQSGETIAELTRYVWDSGFGISTTGRLPWQHASSQGVNVCPSSQTLHYDTRFFVDTVLIPKQGD